MEGEVFDGDRMKKILILFFASFLFISCGGIEDTEHRPIGHQTFPAIDYSAVKRLSQRAGPEGVTRMVGWDEEFYYFDWYQANMAISRGIGRVERLQFDSENKGALTLEKGKVTVKNEQVRTLKFE